MRVFTWADRVRAAAAVVVALCALSLAVAPALASDSRVAWGTSPVDAFRAARESGRPVLAYLTGTPCGRRAPIGDPGDVHDTDCEKLEMRTIGQAAFVAAAARFEPLILDLSAGRSRVAAEDDLLRRWRVGTLPTLLVADPWGNEILRLVGPTPLDAAVRVLEAMPADLRSLRAAGEGLAADPGSLPALLAAARFYEKGLRPVAERYYEAAAGTGTAKSDAAARRSVALSRGLNLLVMGKAKEAAGVYSDEASRGLDTPQSDLVLFGWAMAALASGDRPKAAQLQADMAKRFPDSPYTSRLADNLRR